MKYIYKHALKTIGFSDLFKTVRLQLISIVKETGKSKIPAMSSFRDKDFLSHTQCKMRMAQIQSVTYI